MITDLSLEVLALEAIVGNKASEQKFFRVLNNNLNIAVPSEIAEESLQVRLAYCFHTIDQQCDKVAA